MLGIAKNNFNILDKISNYATIKYVDEDEIEYLYQGEVNEKNELDGYGKLWSNDYSYHGYFKNNMLSGKGIMKYIGNDKELNNTFSVTYEGEFSNNKKNGHGLETYKNNEYYEGSFLNDFRHGKGILYNPNGVPKFDSFWELGRSVNTEEITEFYKNGNIKYKGNYNGQSRHGKGTLFNDKGFLIFSGEFDNGLLLNGKLYTNNFVTFDGTFIDNLPDSGKFYYQNGIQMCEGKIVSGMHGDFLIGESKIFNTSSKLIFEGEMINIYDYPDNSNLNIDGDLRMSSYTEISSVLGYSINNFFNDKKDFKILFGNGTEYYASDSDKMSNNIPIHKRTIKMNDNKLLHSQNISYHENGQIKKIANYKNGKLDGECFEYSNTNVILSKCNYIENKKHNDYFSYFNNGIIKDIIRYDNDEPINITSYYPSGKKKIKGNCLIISNKVLIEGDNIKIYYDNEPNSLKFEGSMTEGKYSNHGILFYENNNKIYEGNFDNGKRNGIGASYYESTGTLEYNGSWVNDERHGEGAIWDESETLVFQGEFQFGDMKFD